MNDIVPLLFGMTLVVMLVAGAYQLYYVRWAQRPGAPAVLGCTQADGTVRSEGRARSR